MIRTHGKASGFRHGPMCHVQYVQKGEPVKSVGMVVGLLWTWATPPSVRLCTGTEGAPKRSSTWSGEVLNRTVPKPLLLEGGKSYHCLCLASIDFSQNLEPQEDVAGIPFVVFPCLFLIAIGLAL